MSEQKQIVFNPFGTTFDVSVDLPDYKGLKKCVVNFPTRKEFYKILKKISNGDDGAEYDVGEKILNDGFVSGDPEFMSDDIYIFHGALKAVEEFELRSGFLKKN